MLGYDDVTRTYARSEGTALSDSLARCRTCSVQIRANDPIIRAYASHHACVTGLHHVDCWTLTYIELLLSNGGGR